LSTWLTIVARSTARDALRRRQLPMTPIDAVPESLLASGGAPPEKLRLPDGLLSPRQKLVLNMLYDRDMEVVSSNGNTLRLTLSGRDTQSPVIRVPLLVRSNSGFKISAAFESQTAKLARLSVIDVHPTGTFVSSHVVHDLQVTPLLNPDNAQPLLVVSGPRVSLGGTLASPNNALQLTLLIHLQAQAGEIRSRRIPAKT